jgi:HK97 family phage prohead protease
MKHLKFDFEKKSEEKGGLIIEGFANANTLDRCNERIEPKGWKLDNYKKNPVILFDHGHDFAFGSMPIGKAIRVEALDDGLFVKAQITKSNTEKLTAVRDLIEEGILKTFSVGFNPIGENSIEKTAEGIIIKAAELIENSIVPVPMNQDSVFAISQRSFKSAVANDWFAKYAKVHQLYKSGAKFAAFMTDHIRRCGHDFPTVMDILKKAGISEQDAINILDGAIIQIDSKVMDQFARALNFKLDEYEVTMHAKNEDDKGCGDNKPPKQKEGESEMTDDAMKEAMDQMHSEAVACATNGEGNPPAWVADEAAWQKAKDAADKTYSRDDAEKYYSVVTWLYLNRFGGAKKEPSQDGGSKSSGSTSQKQAMAGGDSAVPPDQNPHLELAKQTNVLLGTLITEMQKVNQKLEMIAKEESQSETSSENTQPPSENTQPPNGQDEEKNLIAKLQKAQDDLRKRIARL